MTRFSCLPALSLLFFVIVNIKRSSCILTNDQKNLNPSGQFPLPNQISSIIDKSQEAVNRFRCPKKWQRLGGSCYSLSNVTSTPVEANHTCNLLQLNNSRLMYIRHPVELFYAAHILTVNNLSTLLLEIDQDLYKGAEFANILSSNDQVQWEEFEKKMRQAHLKYNKVKTQSHKDRSRDGKTIDGITDEQIENVDHIRNACHQIKWNVVNNNSNVLILTVELDSDKPICSLSNMEITVAYTHLCQYVLDLCFNNILCGKHGNCVNIRTGFKCSCSFLFGGSFCDEFSNKNMQILIAIPIILIGFLLTNTTIQNFLGYVIKWFFNRFRRQRISFPEPIDDTHDPSQSVEEGQTLPQASTDQTPKKARIEFKLSTAEQRLRFYLVGTVTAVFFLVLFGIPAIYHVGLSQMGNTDSFQLDSLIDHNIRTIGQCGDNTIFRVDNFIFLFISIILVITFSLLRKVEVHDQNDNDGQSGIISPIKLFLITDRYETAAIVAIQTFEILEILEEILIDIDESSQSGVFVETFKRMFFVILIGFRYYPILASLQLQNIFVRLLTFIYIISSMVHMIIRESSCVHWLPFSKKFSSLEQAYFHMDLNCWSILYGFAKNGLHCLLIGYIGAELTMRLVYDSIYIARKNGRKISNITYRKIDKYSFSIDYKNKRFLRNANKHAETEECNIPRRDNLGRRIRKFFIDRLRKCANRIYQQEDDFRFTTIVIYTYTVAYIILFHLTCTLIFLYTTQKKSYISFLKYIFEFMLNIEVEEWSFQGEVVLSAIITMILYGIQLFLSIKNYRKNMRELYKDFSDNIQSIHEPKKHEIIPKGIQYPAFILRYLLGGFFICFNLIFFIVTILNVIRTQIGSFQWAFQFIIPVLVLYCLQKVIIRITNTLFTDYHSRDENDLRLNRPYSILMYFNLISSFFIGIVSSIHRLIISVLVNILFMPRIDYNCLVPPLQTLDTAHMAFLSFLRLEILYTYPTLLEFSRSVTMASSPGVQDHVSIGEQQSDNDVHASTCSTQSQQPDQRSLIDDYNPADTNSGSDEDDLLTTALLHESSV